ncbi:MAG TPA: hypothetical protein VFY56_01335 [Propionibacteriaceae bacterium]|nr:hypothetical protein [Propionibacteriaceae bacterium]
MAVGSVIGIGSGDGSVRSGALLHAPAAEVGLPSGRDMRRGRVAIGIACCLRSVSRTSRTRTSVGFGPLHPAGSLRLVEQVARGLLVTPATDLGCAAVWPPCTQTAAEAEEALATARRTEPHQHVLIADLTERLVPI